MIYVTGDTHGEQKRWEKQIHPILRSGDTLIVAGDFGVGFWGDRERSEETFYDWIAEQPYTVLFVDGNHEIFPKLASYPEEVWCGGKVHKLRHNLLHLMRGEIYEIEGMSVFAFGGAYSVDRYRRKEGFDWFKEEMPSEEEYENARRNLARCHYSVDYIITHTCPAETVEYMARLPEYGISNMVAEERDLQNFLSEICGMTSYKGYYFGHFHIDREFWKGQTAVLNTVRKLETR